MKFLEEEFVDTNVKISNKIKKEFNRLKVSQAALYLKEVNLHKLYEEIASDNLKVWDSITPKLDKKNYVYKIVGNKIYHRIRRPYEK